MNILMLYPKFPGETFWSLTRSTETFMHRSANMPPLGLLTLASYLPDDFLVRVIDRNMSNETEADWQWADVVFLSLMLAQEDDGGVCLRNARAHGKPVAIGGPYTHARPDIAASVDWVCFGEAESIVDDFVADLRANRRGRQYDGGNKTDMEQVRVPRFDLLTNVNDYLSMSVQFSRGCPFRCEFCDIIEIYGRVARTKTPAQVLAELALLDQLGFHGYVFLVDDNFIGNKRRAKELLKELAAWNIEHAHPFKYFTEASINLADDEALLDAMADAGVLQVFIGIETPDRTLLKNMLKMQNVPGDPLVKLNRIRSYGIHILGGFIVGFDGEDLGVFDSQRSFVQASGIGLAMLGLLQAVPHTQLARRLKHEGRLLEDVEVQGISTVNGLNFIPKGSVTKRMYLEEYGRLVNTLYSPELFFERVMRGMMALRPRLSLLFRLKQSRSDLPALLRLIRYMGFKEKGIRSCFWRALAGVLWRNPGALEAFVWDCYGFYCLREHVVYIQHELARYLASPAPGDVLDRVVPVLESTPVAMV